MSSPPVALFRVCAIGPGRRADGLPAIVAPGAQRALKAGAMLAPAGDQQHQCSAIGIAAFDDGAEATVGFGLPEQCGRFELCGQSIRQAGSRRDR